MNVCKTPCDTESELLTLYRLMEIETEENQRIIELKLANTLEPFEAAEKAE